MLLTAAPTETQYRPLGHCFATHDPNCKGPRTRRMGTSERNGCPETVQAPGGVREGKGPCTARADPCTGIAVKRPESGSLQEGRCRGNAVWDLIPLWGRVLLSGA